MLELLLPLTKWKVLLFIVLLGAKFALEYLITFYTATNPILRGCSLASIAYKTKTWQKMFLTSGLLRYVLGLFSLEIFQLCNLCVVC